MKNNKGFTLIEMLVVIAIIGLLSSVVLVALGPSRTKAKDTRIISDLRQIQVIAETLYNGTTGKYPDSTALKANASVTIASTDITANGGTGFAVMPATGATTVAFYATLNSTKIYCLDSDGFGGEIASITSAADGTCN
ncbi:MAG: type II secretion system protein [Patescibacteria group bacterium]